MAMRSAELTLSATSGYRGRVMFEVSTNWLNGAVQVAAYALVIGAGLWLLSKIEIKEKESKR